MPQTRAELDALAAQRSELRDQLQSVQQRRGSLLDELLLARGPARDEIAARVKALDDRGARLEREILAADDAIAAGIATGITARPPRPEENTVISIPPINPPLYSLRDVVVVNVGTLALMAVLFWAIVRRRLRASVAPAVPDQSRRLDQLQQAVDTVAVEVERISEGQRFVTKLLHERLQPALGAGAAQPLPAQRAEPARESQQR